MPITQMDVAKRAKVSRSLVSKVLYGDPNIRVSEEKRTQIITLAKDMGYRPNAMATSLRSGKTNTVVSLSKFDPIEHTSTTERGSIEFLAVELSLIGLELKIRPYASLTDVLAGIDELVSTSLCDAVVLWLIDEEAEQAGIALDRYGIPFVAVGNHEARHPEWLQVDFDHKGMMRACVEHLISQGRKRIAYMGYDNNYGYVHRLQDGFQSAMLDLTGAQTPADLIWRVDLSSKRSEDAIDTWLEFPEDRQPDGLVIGAGNIAWRGVERALARRGRRIGLNTEEFAVTGQRYVGDPLIYGHAMVFDNVEMSRISQRVAQLLGQTLAAGGGKIANPIVRIMPAMVPIDNMEFPILE